MFHAIGIAQRGIGSTADPWPTNEAKVPTDGPELIKVCDGKRGYTINLLTGGKEPAPFAGMPIDKLTSWTTCECDLPEDGVPIPSSAFIDPADLVSLREHVAFQASRDRRCYCLLYTSPSPRDS